MSTITLDTAELSDERMEALRERVRALLATTKMSQAAAAKDADIAYTTFAAWLGGKYAGDNQRVATDVQRWLTARAAREQAATIVPPRPGFVMTPTAERIWPVVQYAQAAPDMTAIVGVAGIGKTTTLRQYAAVTPNVWLCTMTPSTAGVSTMMAEICFEMGLEVRAASQYARAIERKVRGTGGLLIVDEAQHLTKAALEQLRSFHDRAQIGIVLSGNPVALARLEGDRRADFDQITSRIGMPITLKGVKAGDALVLAEAWGITDAAELALCKTIAMKPGALRRMSKALALAGMVAAGDGRPRNIDDIKAAWSQLDPRSLVSQSA